MPCGFTHSHQKDGVTLYQKIARPIDFLQMVLGILTINIPILSFVVVIYSETGFKAECREAHDTSFQSIVLRQDYRQRVFYHALGLDNDQAHHVLHVWLGVHRPLGC